MKQDTQNTDNAEVGCGGNCACAQAAANESEAESCALPEGGVTLDKDGKCPCGKSKDDCCHSESIAGENALHELCDEHNGKHVCDVDSDLQKTAA
jgi:hypothetical protein